MRAIITCFFTFAAILAGAQVTTEKRVELELKDEYKNEVIYQFGEKGFLMFSKSEEKEDGQFRWKYERYNTDLVSEDKKEIMLDKRYALEETSQDTNNIYHLYRDKNKFVIVSVEVPSLESNKVEFELESRTTVNKFAVLNDYAYLTTVKSKQPFVLSVNLKSGERKFLPITIDGIKPKNISVEHVQILKEAKEIFVFLEVLVTKKLSKTYIIRMDDEGNKKDVYDFSMNLKEIITSATASYIAPDKYVFTGTYSKKDRFSSEGMFFSIINKGKIEKINFYNFLDLENFLKYLPEKKQEKIEKKKARKEKRGKELVLRYFLAPHNIIQTDDGYIYLAEAYYPTYRTEMYTTTTYINGTPTMVTQTRQVFDGYQYTHAFLAKFNKEGEKQWDQTFKMWLAYKPFYVKRFINIAERNQNSVKLVFASSNKIVSKKISFDGEVLQENESEEIETGLEGDKTKATFSNIGFWYGNYFIAYGSQTIKNKTDEDVARKRRVYFINKLKYE